MWFFLAYRLLPSMMNATCFGTSPYVSTWAQKRCDHVIELSRIQDMSGCVKHRTSKSSFREEKKKTKRSTATDRGRAFRDFSSGAMAFCNEQKEKKGIREICRRLNPGSVTVPVVNVQTHQPCPDRRADRLCTSRTEPAGPLFIRIPESETISKK